MIPEFIVCDAPTAADLVLTERWTGRVVSLRDPFVRPHPWLGIPRARALALAFDDVTPAEVPSSSYGHYAFPTVNHVREVLAYEREMPGAPLLVHCQKGVSRSTACALAVLVTRRHDIVEAFDELEATVDACFENELRPDRRIRPNSELVRFTDELLGCEGELVREVAARLLRWRREDVTHRFQHPGSREHGGRR